MADLFSPIVILSSKVIYGRKHNPDGIHVVFLAQDQLPGSLFPVYGKPSRIFHRHIFDGDPDLDLGKGQKAVVVFYHRS